MDTDDGTLELASLHSRDGLRSASTLTQVRLSALVSSRSAGRRHAIQTFWFFLGPTRRCRQSDARSVCAVGPVSPAEARRARRGDALTFLPETPTHARSTHFHTHRSDRTASQFLSVIDPKLDVQRYMQRKEKMQ